MVDVKRLRRLALWAAGALLAGVLALAAYALVLLPFTPSVEGLLAARDDKPACCSPPMARCCHLPAHPRDWLPLGASRPRDRRADRHRRPPLLEHPGVDWRRTLSSLAQTLGGDTQGGSTLTQQLARNAFPVEIGRARHAQAQGDDHRAEDRAALLTSGRFSGLPQHRRSTTTPSASRWRRAPISTSPPPG